MTLLLDQNLSPSLVIRLGDVFPGQLAFLRGAPPKVVWVQRGNASTADVEHVLRVRRAEIAAFLADPDAAFLAIR